MDKERRKELAKIYYQKNKEKLKEYSKKWRLENRERYLKNGKEYRLENKKKIRNSQYKRLYKIDLKKYNKILIQQNYKCAICENKNGKRLVIDHNHKTGKIRGLLCTYCNIRIGYFEDKKFCIKVKEYLR